MKRGRYPSQEFLKECFNYNDGKLIWKERPLSHFNTEVGRKIFNSSYIGKDAGYLEKQDNRYRITISGHIYLKSNLVWIFFNGDISIGIEIDHCDNDGSNDKIDNLRLSTPEQQQANRLIQKNNTTGYKGVTWHRGSKKYHSSIGFNKKRIHLGKFDCPIEAHQAYVKAAIELYGEFANSG